MKQQTTKIYFKIDLFFIIHKKWRCLCSDQTMSM